MKSENESEQYLKQISRLILKEMDQRVFDIPEPEINSAQTASFPLQIRDSILEKINLDSESEKLITAMVKYIKSHPQTENPKIEGFLNQYGPQPESLEDSNKIKQTATRFWPILQRILSRGRIKILTPGDISALSGSNISTDLNRESGQMVQFTEHYSQIVGSHPKLLELFSIISKVAASDLAVLITGETGTGKELIARALHRSSDFRDGEFVAVNCGAIPEQLFESEFFGYCKGAFTGAVKDKAGYFETAGGGTLFLDEIGELPRSSQVKLLRVLQDKKLTPIGTTRPRQVNFRLIAATNRELDSLIQQKLFREDLYYRVNELIIELPALRERREDIPQLTNFFLTRISSQPPKSFSATAMELLMNFNWPGNVRQLEAVVKRGFILSGRRQTIEPADLPEYLIKDVAESDFSQLPTPAINQQMSLAEYLRKAESVYISSILNTTGGHIGQAAKRLGISRRTLERKMAVLNLRHTKQV